MAIAYSYCIVIINHKRTIYQNNYNLFYSSNWCGSLHSPSHDIQEVGTTGSDEGQVYIDKDYTQFKQSSNITDYNYLDPNFFPAL